MSKWLPRVLFSKTPALISQAKSCLGHSLYQRTQETQAEMETKETAQKASKEEWKLIEGAVEHCILMRKVVCIDSLSKNCMYPCCQRPETIAVFIRAN